MIRRLGPWVFPGGLLFGVICLASGTVSEAPWWSGGWPILAWGFLGIGVVLSAVFRQNRALLMCFFGALFWALAAALAADGPPPVWKALLVLVPVNASLILLSPEKGSPRLSCILAPALLGAETAFLAWQASLHPSEIVRLLDRGPLDVLIGTGSGLLLWLPVFALAGYRALARRNPLDQGMFWVLVAVYAGSAVIPRLDLFRVFWIGAAVILVAALLQQAHRMAYRDELTGLPSRRALDDFMGTLRPPFAAAMVDLDHFKDINDTHGHAVGDQVLKKVAAHLQEVRAGGRAFRYGGEEFAVLFPGRDREEVWSAAEELRLKIQRDPFIFRRPDRPRRRPKAPPPPAPSGPRMNVTVSIGLADARASAKGDARAVLKEADGALYRAKNAGRNCVKD
jgi:diguanylate cyclase (GGDEF)-like protein